MILDISMVSVFYFVCELGCMGWGGKEILFKATCNAMRDPVSWIGTNETKTVA